MECGDTIRFMIMIRYVTIRVYAEPAGDVNALFVTWQMMMILSVLLFPYLLSFIVVHTVLYCSFTYFL